MVNSLYWLRKYPNLAKGLVLDRPNQLWVSDTTYWNTCNGFLYISFVTDAYSQKVVGCQVSNGLGAVSTIEALKNGPR